MFVPQALRIYVLRNATPQNIMKPSVTTWLVICHQRALLVSKPKLLKKNTIVRSNKITENGLQAPGRVPDYSSSIGPGNKLHTFFGGGGMPKKIGLNRSRALRRALHAVLHSSPMLNVVRGLCPKIRLCDFAQIRYVLLTDVTDHYRGRQ